MAWVPWARQMESGGEPHALQSLADFLACIAEEFPFFDDRGDFWRDHLFPTRVGFFHACKDVAAENRQTRFVVILNGLDEMIFEQIRIEMPQMRRDTQIIGGDDSAGGLVPERIDVKFQRVFKKPAKRFQNSAF